MTIEREVIDGVSGPASPGDPLVPVVKAYVVGGEDDDTVVQAPNARPGIELELQYFLNAGALIPRYDPWACAILYEKSSALRPCVESYSTNIDAFGFRLEPVIDLDKSDAEKRIRAAMRQQRLHDHNPAPITDEDVAAIREVIKREMELEEFQLTTFFAYCCPDTSFVELRKQTREDVETGGNGYWEVVRDGAGKLQHFTRIEAVTMRIRPLELTHHVVDTPQKISPIAYAKAAVPRRFRSFVQLVNGVATIYFKEFGDPRTMSARTSRYYASVADLQQWEGDGAVAATEVIHHKVFSTLGPYGVPRWVGATMNVLGLRASEEVNFTYFDNKGVPPLALLVSGGALKTGAVDKIERYIKENIKGRENFHSVLVIEATSSVGAGAAGRCTIELRSLMDAQLQDALFQVYEKNSDQKIGRQFRLPDLLRGASQEVNRAQAESVLEMAEQQVFQPIRESFDHLMNRRILADMGIRFWTFVTNSAKSSDAVELTNIATTWLKAGALVPNEGRAIASDVLNKDYKPIDEVWARQPLPLTLAGIIPGSLGPPAPAAPGVPLAPGAAPAAPTPEQKEEGLAARLIALAEALRGSSDGEHGRVLHGLRAADNAKVYRVSDAFFDDLVEKDAR